MRIAFIAIAACLTAGCFPEDNFDIFSETPPDGSKLSDMAGPDFSGVDLIGTDIILPDLVNTPDIATPTDDMVDGSAPDLTTLTDAAPDGPAPDLANPPNCNNKKMDGDETDVDCGGSCSPCPKYGQACKANPDCDGARGLQCKPQMCSFGFSILEVGMAAKACRWFDEKFGGTGDDFQVKPNMKYPGPPNAFGVVCQDNFVIVNGKTVMNGNDVNPPLLQGTFGCQKAGGAIFIHPLMPDPMEFIGRGGTATCSQL